MVDETQEKRTICSVDLKENPPPPIGEKMMFLSHNGKTIPYQTLEYDQLSLDMMKYVAEYETLTEHNKTIASMTIFSNHFIAFRMTFDKDKHKKILNRLFFMFMMFCDYGINDKEPLDAIESLDDKKADDLLKYTRRLWKGNEDACSHIVYLCCTSEEAIHEAFKDLKKEYDRKNRRKA